MTWIDTPTRPAIPLALKKKEDQTGPQKISEITAELPSLGGLPAQAVPAPTNPFAQRPLAGLVQPVLPTKPRRHDGTGEASNMLRTKSAIVAAVLNEAESMATRGKSPILIGGESGTGKTCLAKQIHAWSGRTGAFVRINCANISGAIGEAELFGHVARAFTDAKEAKKGALEAADGGTVFLDEVGELTPELQKNLLDFLEEGTFHPVGGITQTKRVDVRIISATHKDLPAMVQAGTFRGDLFWRLAKLRLEMPSLRERGEDMLGIIADLCKRGGYDISPEVIDYLGFGSYPGNIRQLDGVLEAAHVGRWTPERAKAEVAKMGAAPALPSKTPPRMLAEDRISVARELSAARRESGGWWTTLELAAAAGVARRTAAADIQAWLTSGDVTAKGEKKCRRYRADDGISQQMPTNANKETTEGGEA